MKNQKTSLRIGILGICILAFGFMQTGCTSLQQSTAVASDDLYDIPSTRSVQKETVINTAPEEQYQEYQNYQDDRYLRLKVANRNRWSDIDDFGYWNDPRYNFAYYPSYIGWNSWYAGYYGASWYYPFGGPYISMGWGGYSPYMNSYYSMGWGFNDFGYGGYGFGGYGFGGYGLGFGYGWNPYYSGYWNPYHSVYGYGGYYGGGYPIRGGNYQNQRAMQNSAPNLASYRNNRQYNNTNNSIQNNNGAIRYSGNPDLNLNFGNLMKRVVTNNPNTAQPNSFDRPARYFSNNNVNSSNQYKTNSAPATNSTPSFNSNTGGRSGGFNSSGSSTSHGRAGRGGE